jgi:hypothetical protein
MNEAFPCSWKTGIFYEEAADRIKQLTGLDRGLTQTRVFLKDLGFHWQRTRAMPVPPKSP